MSLLRVATAPIRWATAPLRWVLRGLVLLVVGLAVYYLVTLAQVWLTSREYAPVHAQAIVVMGAAQYNGAPSPDLRARLDEALLLFRHGYAPLVVTTGSKEPGDRYTESGTGARYLESKGVPAADIVAVGGRSTWANLALAAAALHARGATDVLVVTDPFHEDRSMAVATAVGLTPHPTPTRTSPIGGTAVVPYFFETAAAVALGRIIGYQHLHDLAVLAAGGEARAGPAAHGGA